jgi:hypothetical protein
MTSALLSLPSHLPKDERRAREELGDGGEMGGDHMGEGLVAACRRTCV